MATTPTHRVRNSSNGNGNGKSSRVSPQPRLGQKAPELQRFGTLRQLPIALSADARSESCRLLNEILADSLARITSRVNTAWYVVGSRDQLVKAGVLTEEGGVLGFGKSLAPSRAMRVNVFTRIDRLRDTVIALPEAKQYRIMSRHDPGLVSVTVDRSVGGTMLIKDPEHFWSASAWLIIVYD